MEISIEVDGVKQISRNLRVFADNLGDMSDFYGEAIDIIDERSDAIFADNGRNVQKSPKWKPLAASTENARQKRRGYYRKSPNRPGILRWTGNLQDNTTKKITKNSGSIQRNAPYAEYHMKGGKNLPKRAFIDLDNQTNTELVRALQTKIERDQKIFGLQV